jgi:hypothetical protein
MGVSVGTVESVVPVYTLTGGSTAPMGVSSGDMEFTTETPSIPVSTMARSGGGAATWEDKELIRRRLEQLRQDDEEIMIFVKEFLTHYGAD